MSSQQPDGEKTVASNRRARHDYAILERFEAGIVLTGSEVKSLRQGRASVGEAYARVERGELWLENMHIPPYEQGEKRGYDPLRARKLLLHRREIEKLREQVVEKGLTVVPLRLYFKGGKVKVEIAVVRGKKLYDKRETEKRREADREAAVAMKQR